MFTKADKHSISPVSELRGMLRFREEALIHQVTITHWQVLKVPWHAERAPSKLAIRELGWGCAGCEPAPAAEGSSFFCLPSRPWLSAGWRHSHPVPQPLIGTMGKHMNKTKILPKCPVKGEPIVTKLAASNTKSVGDHSGTTK